MNIYFPLFTGTNQFKADKNNKEQLQTYLPKNHVCNFKLPYYNCDHVSFSGSEVKLCNSAISGKIKFLSSIFEFDQKEIEKLSDFDSLLKFMSIKNLNGHSIKSVLTESLNNIENKKTTEEKITNLTKDEIPVFCKTIKLVFGLGKYKPHSYNEVLDIINSDNKIKFNKFNNKQYVQKILKNQRFINMIRENILAENAKDLFGVKGIHPVTKIDRSQNNAKVIGSRMDFFSSIFKLDEETRKSIKNSDSLLKFINTENSSGHSIRNVLTKSLNLVAEQNPSYNRLLDFTKVVKFFINSEKMPTTETIRERLNFTTIQYVQELFNDSNFINKTIENISPEKAENLVGVNGLQPIPEKFKTVKNTTVKPPKKEKCSPKVSADVKRKKVKKIPSKNLHEVQASSEIKSENVFTEAGKKQKDLPENNSINTRRKTRRSLRKETDGFIKIKSSMDTLTELNTIPEKTLIKEKMLSQSTRKNNTRKQFFNKSDAVTVKTIAPFIPNLPYPPPNPNVDYISLSNKYKIDRYMHSEDSLREHVIKNVRPEIFRIMKEIKAEYYLGITEDKDMPIMLEYIRKKFGINAKKQIYSKEQIYNDLISSGIKISRADFEVVSEKTDNLLYTKMKEGLPEEIYLPKNIPNCIENINKSLPPKYRVDKNLPEEHLKIFLRNISPQIIEALKKFSIEDDPDIEILKKIIELRFGIGDNEIKFNREIFDKLTELGYAIPDKGPSLTNLSKRANLLLIKKLDPNFQEDASSGYKDLTISKINRALNAIFGTKHTIDNEKDLFNLLDEPYLTGKSRKDIIQEVIENVPEPYKGIIQDYLGFNGKILSNPVMAEKYGFSCNNGFYSTYTVQRYLYNRELKPYHKYDGVITESRSNFLINNLLPDCNVPKTDKYPELYNFLNTKTIFNKSVKDILLEAFNETIEQCPNDPSMMDQIKALKLWLGLEGEVEIFNRRKIQEFLTQEYDLSDLLRKRSGLKKIRANIPAEYKVKLSTSDLDRVK